MSFNKKKGLVTLTLITGLLLSGCATSTYVVSGNSTAEPEKTEMQTFFIGGIGQEKKINAADVCGGADKVAHVSTRTGFLDGVLSIVTWGIFTPRTAKVYCIRA